MNRNLATKMSNFLLGNGFYIALTMCVGLIGVSGYYLMDSITQDSISASAQAQMETPSNEVTMPNPPTQTTVSPALLPESIPTIPVLGAETENPLDSGLDGGLDSALDGGKEDSTLETLEETMATGEESEETPLDELGELGESDELPLEEAASFVAPVSGLILLEHSVEVLAYSETFGDWRIHTGIDVATSANASVYAVADGYVSAVFPDELRGNTVVLVHADGLESSYCNLSETTFVELGETVKMGQEIATVGSTALSATEQNPYLHVSFTENGELVDPMDYLPEFS